MDLVGRPIQTNLYMLTRGVYGYGSIPEPAIAANPIQLIIYPNPAQPPPNPQVIGSGIKFEFLKPSIYFFC
jgi:hypothetical protein